MKENCIFKRFLIKNNLCNKGHIATLGETIPKKYRNNFTLED